MEQSETLIARVIDRVQQRMPAAPRHEIEELVHGLFLEYAGSRIRDFVQIFVEREAVEALRERARQLVRDTERQSQPA